ncbi:Rieske (2Fe-2S) protein [Paeniglutamicibacter sp. Y32M11]|uniref:Rieske (2Fe-2S) protein n=1 Tax=Paeniglutamicibacter sp. Y32M11 TaxID=2853258 RepID=UPI001C5342FC|nr:Rieske (2Fe-2S) protein [Paeniglutamicibacter sp. Y32M11]QXQ11629.1 Rieske (2Fe-2S) protein [Paeniglutamicibacter sp. Y32M11]
MSSFSSPSTRRAFVGGTMAAGATLALAACGDGSSAAPNNTPSAPPVPVGEGVVVATTAELSVGTRLAVSAIATQGDTAGKESGYLLFRPSEKSVLAYTAICTHQGCAVGTKAPSGEGFYCACHGSAFDATDGKATAGPARGALERFAAEIQGQNVLIFI